MGSTFAPIYATLVLAYLEEKMYVQSEKDLRYTSKPITKDF